MEVRTQHVPLCDAWRGCRRWVRAAPCGELILWGTSGPWVRAGFSSHSQPVGRGKPVGCATPDKTQGNKSWTPPAPTARVDQRDPAHKRGTSGWQISVRLGEFEQASPTGYPGDGPWAPANMGAEARGEVVATVSDGCWLVRACSSHGLGRGDPLLSHVTIFAVVDHFICLEVIFSCILHDLAVLFFPSCLSSI